MEQVLIVHLTEFCRRHPTKKQAKRYADLSMGHLLPGLNPANDLFYLCALFVLRGGDRCRVGDFVIVTPPSSQTPLIGRVEEIVQRMNNTGPHPDGVLVRHFTIDDSPNSYGMPYVLPTNHWSLEHPQVRHCSVLQTRNRVLTYMFQSLVCTVNTQHACAELGCGMTGTRRVLQERALSDMTQPEIKHNPPNDRRILNLAQMRDAHQLRRYRMQREELDERKVLENAAQVTRAGEIQKERLANELIELVGGSEPAPPVDRRLGALQRGAARPSASSSRSRRQSPAPISRDASSASGSFLQWTTPLTPDAPMSPLNLALPPIQWTESTMDFDNQPL